MRGRKPLVLIAVVMMGVAARFAWITSPPFDFAASRQAYGALRARMIYLDGNGELPAWKQSVLARVRPDVPQLEPPLMEHAAALAYRLVGSEQLWLPRSFSIAFWLLGGVFVYALASRLGGGAVPMAGLALYLALPFGIFASRSIQPDSLLVALILVSLYFIVRFHELPTSGLLLAAIVSSAAATLVKPPIAIFFLVGVFLALGVARCGWRHGIINWPTAAFLSLSLAPAAIYSAAFLKRQAGGGYVEPSFVADSLFWRGWMSMLGRVITYPVSGISEQNLSGFVFLGADLVVGALMLLGLLATRRRDGRALLLGLWGGYVVFAVVFAPKVSTHDYYSLPLVPIIALSLAPLAKPLLAAARRARPLPRAVAVAGACLLIVAYGSAVVGALADRRYERHVRAYKEIGALTRHTSRGAHVDKFFQSPLLYYAWIGSATLAYPGEVLAPGSIEARFLEITRRHGRPEYLIVAPRAELAALAGLESFASELDVVATDERYVVFELPTSG